MLCFKGLRIYYGTTKDMEKRTSNIKDIIILATFRTDEIKLYWKLTQKVLVSKYIRSLLSWDDRCLADRIFNKYPLV
jgi:hypothetical protein